MSMSHVEKVQTPTVCSLGDKSILLYLSHSLGSVVMVSHSEIDFTLINYKIASIKMVLIYVLYPKIVCQQNVG